MVKKETITSSATKPDDCTFLMHTIPFHWELEGTCTYECPYYSPCT